MCPYIIQKKLSTGNRKKKKEKIRTLEDHQQKGDKAFPHKSQIRFLQICKRQKKEIYYTKKVSFRKILEKKKKERYNVMSRWKRQTSFS